MRITRACEYAVRCMLYLALHGRGRVVGRLEVSEAMEIPKPFLSKVAQQLARARFIEIVQGALGGYRLLASPGELSLLDVVETMEGEIFLNDCVMRPDSCFRHSECSVHRVWRSARDQLRATLGSATLEKLLAEEHCIPSALGDGAAGRGLG